MEKELLILACKKEFWDRARNILSKPMFTKEAAVLFETIRHAHSAFEGDISLSELGALTLHRHPALSWAAKEELEELVGELQALPAPNPGVGIELAKGLWRRHKAKLIGESAIDIWTGKSEDFGTILRLLEQVGNEQMGSDSTALVEVTQDIEEIIRDANKEAEFKFGLPTLATHLDGMHRGTFGIIFARPELGKTSFTSYLTAEYLCQGHTVAYFANEEPAARIKLRILCAYLSSSMAEITKRMAAAKTAWQAVNKGLKIFDTTAVSIAELNAYVELNKPDIVIVDQLDKVRIEGEFNRSDERLQSLYQAGRELAKRNNCLVWAVTQASYEAEGQPYPTYAMMDGSRTGKAAEADVIIGIGKSRGEEEQGTRNLCVSKNKLTGWHGHVISTFDIERSRFEV